MTKKHQLKGKANYYQRTPTEGELSIHHTSLLR